MIRSTYLGNIGYNMKKNCSKKVQKCLKENARFITCYETKKKALFCSAKDSILIHQKSNIIYKVTCPSCNEDYVEKNDPISVTRLYEHASHEDQPMYQHVKKCEHFAHIVGLLRIPDTDASTTEINNKQHFVNAVIFLTFVLWTQAVTGPNCNF